MNDSPSEAPDEQAARLPAPADPVVAASNTDHDEQNIRYFANLQLILRRLADHQRTDAHAKPARWWWQSR